MHELSIVEGILEAVIPEVEKYDVSRVLSIKLRIGELSGVVPECINYYFDIASRGTVAEGAKIVIEKVPVRIKCPDCGYDGIIRLGHFKCPECSGTGFKIISGKEYYVDSVEAE